jgi:phage shock protein A
MGILNRLFTLGKAKVNTTVEKAEAKDPIGIMKVALLEAQEQANQLEAAMRSATATKIGEKRELEELKESAESWKGKFEIAKAGDDEEFARTVGGKYIDAKKKVERKQEKYDKLCEAYDLNKSRYDEKMALVAEYEEKVEEAEDSFEMSSAMTELNKSVSSAGGTSSFDKIDAMSKHVDKSADMMTATTELADTEDVKLDKKMKELERQKELDELMG